MIKEYYHFIKEYLKIAEFKKLSFFLLILTAFLYKISQLLIPLFASFIIKYATISDWKLTFISIFLLGLSYLLYRIFYFFNCKMLGSNAIYCYTNLQTKILNKLMIVDDQFTKTISHGKLLSSINKDVLNIGYMADKVSEVLTGIFQVLLLLIIVSSYSIWFGILFIISCLLYVGTYNKLDRKQNYYYDRQRKNLDQYSDLLGQVLNGLSEIKTFDMLPKLRNKLLEINKKYAKNYFLKRRYYVLQQNECHLIVRFFHIILYFILIFFIANGTFTVDILVLMIGYYASSTGYFQELIDRFVTIREVNVSVKRINSILNYQNREMIPSGDYSQDDIEGIIEFQKVNFTYRDKQILHNFNLKLMPYKINVLVGTSGTGKTTIFNLLLRLYKVNSGNILIDNMNIYEYSKDVYLSNVTVVNQKPFIFNMSIRKNLDLVDNHIEHQIAACKRVGIHDFISSLPQGYNTILREDGSNISGGQKQLISLARTILSKAEILLFDEITSSLDPDTEKQISMLLEDLKKDHTIVMITHKPDLMKRADRIIVMDHGKIVGDGKHKELLDNNEYYRFLQAKKSGSRFGVFDHD